MDCFAIVAEEPGDSTGNSRAGMSANSQSELGGGSLQYCLDQSLDASKPSERRHSLKWAFSFDMGNTRQQHNCELLTANISAATAYTTCSKVIIINASYTLTEYSARTRVCVRALSRSVVSDSLLPQ